MRVTPANDSFKPRGGAQEKVAEMVGKERSTVANYLRLLTLPRFVLELVDDASTEARTCGFAVVPRRVTMLTTPDSAVDP